MAPASANLIVNGSFEVPHQPSGYGYVAGGSNVITGWTTVLNGVEHFDPAIYSIGTAHDGNQVVDLAPTTFTGGGIEQTVATVAAQQYRLSFWGGTSNYANRTGTGVIKVSIDGGAAQSFNLNNANAVIAWQGFSLDFAGTGNPTTITFFNDEDANTHFAFLDDVSLAPVPEPFTLVLAAAGLATAARRRKR
ncbi:MAG: DUF642 domain-containing protein [Chthonomonadaceae bacterium]|nr:DUF642 domain-containing protein [Chthonomonadaceae bacterium]